MQNRDKKRILILGGGFAGVECTLKLESYFKNNPNIEITLVSEDLSSTQTVTVAYQIDNNTITKYICR